MYSKMCGVYSPETLLDILLEQEGKQDQSEQVSDHTHGRLFPQTLTLMEGAAPQTLTVTVAGVHGAVSVHRD